MIQAKYFRAIEDAIAAQQHIQMTNRPTSEAWENASKEIHHLAELLTGKPCEDAIGKR